MQQGVSRAQFEDSLDRQAQAEAEVSAALDAFATRCGLHPDMVRRLVALGLVTCRQDARGDLRFEPSALVTVARIQRLRTGLGLNYAAIGLVLDLLSRGEDK